MYPALFGFAITLIATLSPVSKKVLTLFPLLYVISTVPEPVPLVLK